MPAFGLIFAVIFPILYAVLGFIFGIIGAVIYNVVAKWTGGLEFTVVDVPPSIAPALQYPAN